MYMNGFFIKKINSYKYFSEIFCQKSKIIEKRQKVYAKCKGNSMQINANHHITPKLSQNRTSKRHNFFNFQYFPMI